MAAQLRFSRPGNGLYLSGGPLANIATLADLLPAVSVTNQSIR